MHCVVGEQASVVQGGEGRSNHRRTYQWFSRRGYTHVLSIKQAAGVRGIQTSRLFQESNCSWANWDRHIGSSSTFANNRRRRHYVFELSVRPSVYPLTPISFDAISLYLAGPLRCPSPKTTSAVCPHQLWNPGYATDDEFQPMSPFHSWACLARVSTSPYVATLCEACQPHFCRLAGTSCRLHFYM